VKQDSSTIPSDGSHLKVELRR
jgi:serine/threonine protein kinase